MEPQQYKEKWISGFGPADRPGMTVQNHTANSTVLKSAGRMTSSNSTSLE